MKPVIRREVERILRAQHQVIHAQQARRAGMTTDDIRHMADTSQWETVHRAVYRVGSAAVTFEQALMAACLAGGPRAVASHQSAAWMWEVVPSPPNRPSITVPVPQHPRVHGVDVYRSRDLDAARTIYRRNIPCTDPLRALVDMAAVCDIGSTIEAIDRSIATGLLTAAALDAELGRRSVQGRRGVRSVRNVLAERGFIGGPPPSVLEAEAMRFFDQWQIPVLQREVKFESDGRYRIDFLLTPNVAAEFDGFAYHCSPEAKANDEARRNRLRLQGLVILVYTWRDLRFDSRRVADEIRRALRQTA